jgi:hypothetical protein
VIETATPSIFNSTTQAIFFAGQQLGDALAVGAQLFDAIGIVDREHRHAMLD